MNPKIREVWSDGDILCATLASEFHDSVTCEVRVSIAGVAETSPGRVKRGLVEVDRFSSSTVRLGPLLLCLVPKAFVKRICEIIGAEPLPLVAKCPTHQTDMIERSPSTWECETCKAEGVPSVA